MTLLIQFTWLLILLTVIGGYKLATRFYRDDPLFGLIFGLVLGLGVLATFPTLIFGLGLLALLLPIVYIVRQSRETAGPIVDLPVWEPLSAIQSRLSAGRTALESSGNRLATSLQEGLRSRSDRNRREVRDRSHTRRRVVPCVRCDTRVIISAPVTECPECGFVLTLVEERNR